MDIKDFYPELKDGTSRIFYKISQIYNHWLLRIFST